MARILVLGGSGEMGSAAVADLVERTGHEVSIGDIRVDAAHALLGRLGAPDRVVQVDVDDPDSLASALADTDVVLNATYMRHNVPVTDAAIAAGVHLVDLGSYYPETLQQLERHAAAEAAGCRIVPGCGVAPGLTNILARLGADQLDTVDAIRMYSYITHPMWTSPGIVVTRFDASTGTSIVWEGGRAVEYPSFSGEERFAFPEPYGEQEVHLVPHPEPLTLPRTIDVRDVVFKVGYPADETERIRVLLELGFDSDEPFELDGTAISPRTVRGRVHRPARHRPDRAERQREARPSRGRQGRPADHADLRLRGRADRPVGVGRHHRHRGGDRRGPRRARRPGRRPSAGSRLRIRGRSSTRSPSATWSSSKAHARAGERTDGLPEDRSLGQLVDRVQPRWQQPEGTHRGHRPGSRRRVRVQEQVAPNDRLERWVAVDDDPGGCLHAVALRLQVEPSPRHTDTSRPPPRTLAAARRSCPPIVPGSAT